MGDDDDRQQAIKRLQAKRGFQQNLVSWLAVSVLLVAIWAFTGADFFWPIFPIAGWGVGVALHGWAAYGQRPISEAAIQREIQRDT